MAKVIVKGVVLRLTNRSRTGEREGFLILIDDRIPMHIPLCDYGPELPAVGESVQVRISVDGLRDAFFQASRRLREKAGRSISQRRWRHDPASGEAEPVRRQRALPIDPDMPQALPDPATQARRQRRLAQDAAGERLPILRQRPLPDPTDVDREDAADAEPSQRSIRDLARALWPRWSSGQAHGDGPDDQLQDAPRSGT